MWTLTNAFLLAWLKWLEVAPASFPYDGPLAFVWMGLFTAPTPTPGPNTVLANITEASYDGYARQEIVWLPEFLSQAGSIKKKGQEMFFAPLDSAVPNTITGAFLVTAASGGVYLGGALAPAPVPLIGPPSGFVLTPEIELPNSPVYGGPEWNV